jgi:lipoyl(octanoyl) transferase
LGSHSDILVEFLGMQDYSSILQRMQEYTLQRGPADPDRIWVTEHPPVYTLGLNANPDHLITPNNIPVVRCDRGGQVTYHGPGQLIIYFLLNLKRIGWGPREMVSQLEFAVIELLSQFGLKANSDPKAPGVYLKGQKVASVGLRIRSGYCYHGLSLNNQMDLSPFLDINPCGYPGLVVTQLKEHGICVKPEELAIPIIHSIVRAIENET